MRLGLFDDDDYNVDYDDDEAMTMIMLITI